MIYGYEIFYFNKTRTLDPQFFLSVFQGAIETLTSSHQSIMTSLHWGLSNKINSLIYYRSKIELSDMQTDTNVII